PPAEEAMNPRSHLLRPLPAAAAVGQPREREDGVVASRHDEHAEARPPDLDERRILPGRRARALDAGMDGKDGRPRHAVLQPRPRRLPQGPRTAREPFVERADAPPEGEDLGAGELERRPWHGPPEDTASRIA